MTKLKRVLFGLLGVYVLAALPLAHAQGQGADEASFKRHFGQKIEEIYGQLHLTDAQKQELEANKQQHRAKMKSVRQEIKADKEALKEELMKVRLDMAKINGLHQQIKGLLSQMEDIKLHSILAVRAILTPEQFSRFLILMHQHKQAHEQQPAQ